MMRGEKLQEVQYDSPVIKHKIVGTICPRKFGKIKNSELNFNFTDSCKQKKSVEGALMLFSPKRE